MEPPAPDIWQSQRQMLSDWPDWIVRVRIQRFFVRDPPSLTVASPKGRDPGSIDIGNRDSSCTLSADPLYFLRRVIVSEKSLDQLDGQMTNRVNMPTSSLCALKYLAKERVVPDLLPHGRFDKNDVLESETDQTLGRPI